MPNGNQIRRSQRQSSSFPVVRWLQAGAVTAGVGMALTVSSGIASADDSAANSGSSSPDFRHWPSGHRKHPRHAPSRRSHATDRRNRSRALQAAPRPVAERPTRGDQPPVHARSRRQYRPRCATNRHGLRQRLYYLFQQPQARNPATQSPRVPRRPCPPPLLRLPHR